MKKYVVLPMLLALLGLSGCSIQVIGLNNAYQMPDATQNTSVATLHISSDDLTLISIDSKSINLASNSMPVTLLPGMHTFNLYIGKNNYTSSTNNMIILSVNIQAQQTYYLKTDGTNAWIENASGTKVSSVDSTMNFSKGVTFD